MKAEAAKNEEMLNTIEVSTNLRNQLKQRETNGQLQGNPCAFAAHLYRERFRVAKNLYKHDLRAHYGCVNAIEFSNGGKYLASGGDDKRVLIWDIEMSLAGLSRPRVLDTEHTSNIFCLGFDRPNRKVFSGGNDDLVIVHDFETGKLDNVYKHDNPVYGLSVDPQCDSIFATAGEDGQILVFDQRSDPGDPLVVAQLRTSFHAVEFHPTGGNYLATANSKRGAAFWDIRKPHHPVIQYCYVEDPPNCMSVRFNSTGGLILALRRRLPPILYNTQSAEPVCTFYHGNYYNSCTMKSCTFAGQDDEFVLSGSDDFNLYVWRVSDVNLERTDQWVETTQMVLYGHRSIVNQVRYNRQKCLLASSGVEKIVKLWSPFTQKGWTGSLLEEVNAPDNPRELYSSYNLPSMSTPPHSWSHMSHDYSTRNTNEDPRMMAFFDSLIQQEIEGWDTNSSSDSPAGSEASETNSSSNDSSSDSSLDDDDDDDAGDGAGARSDRRTKRTFMRRKERKHSKAVTNKLKIQRNKYANRIAYLIATKRNTLRRLAIKGASLSNRGLHKIVRVGGNNLKAPSGSTTVRSFVSKRRAFRQNVVRSGTTPSTSTGAASCSVYRSQRRKQKKQRSYESSSDDDIDLGSPVASGSGRYTGITNPSNIPVPSTSTGITSSLKDDIIRLRQQQQQQNFDDSDEDDDDYPYRTNATLNGFAPQPAEIVVDPTVQPTKKLNGVRRANDAAVMGRSSSGAPSVNTVISLSRNVSATLTQRSAAEHQSYNQSLYRSHMRAAATSFESTDDRRTNVADRTANASSRTIITTAAVATTTATEAAIPPHRAVHETARIQTPIATTATATESHTTLPPQTSNNAAKAAATTTTTRTATSRRRPNADLLDQYSSHSNSRLSNSSYQDEVLGGFSSSSSSSSSSTSSSPSAASSCAAQATTALHATPFKRRKLSPTDCIHEPNISSSSNNNNSIRTVSPQQRQQHQHGTNNRNSNHLPPTDDDDDDDDDSDDGNANVDASTKMSKATRFVINNTVQTTNFSNHRSMNSNYNSTQRSINNSNNDTTTAANLLQTPDSGISVATNVTPNYKRDTDDSSSSAIDNYCNASEDTVVGLTASTTSRQQVLSPLAKLFHQKVARVRRNYRKTFAEESESE